MLKLRLRPLKCQIANEKLFEIVSVDSRRKRDTHTCKNVGYYRMYLSGNKTVTLNKSNLIAALSSGGQPTKSVEKLIQPIMKDLL
jgi:ribosomal protein S16|uniref:ribosomal protein S16 n=1 Tax=Ancyromonas sigmoides TaxID=85707 RepID=UPI0028D85E17|nr:ribosomal protein S16 [Ancyromonas sigmoides]WMQ52555.1 ribosomal protein S16 [Ancyromonas sigmoides]